MTTATLENKLWWALIASDEQAVRDLLECQPMEWVEGCIEPTLSAVDADNEGEAQRE